MGTRFRYQLLELPRNRVKLFLQELFWYGRHNLLYLPFKFFQSLGLVFAPLSSPIEKRHSMLSLDINIYYP